MNYSYTEAAHFITHKHELAKTFENHLAAEQVVNQVNIGRPESCKPFRTEFCKECERHHIRRGANVFIKAV